MPNRRVSGRSILYHYIQKVVIPRGDDFSRRLVAQLITDLSIWMPPQLCSAAPVLLPFCVRDASIKNRGEWGTANAQGCLRDKNVILKNLVVSWKIKSPNLSAYHGAGRGRGFVACHCWRHVRIDGVSLLSPTHPKTYTFIPNLAWLPDPISRLTDHEGSYAQQVLQAISYRLYAPLRRVHPSALAAIWDAFPAPALEMEIDLQALNYFEVTPRGILIRRKNLLCDVEDVLAVVNGARPPSRPVRSQRYLPSLTTANDTSALRAWLESYHEFLQQPVSLLS
jgi:hypothetical protein